MSFYQGAKKLTPILRFIFNVRGVDTDNLPKEGPVILCSNHRSNFDPLMLGIVLPRSLFFMAKESLFRVPLLNSLIRALGAFPVTRGAHDTEAIRKAISIVERGDVLAMFPEGHRQKQNGEPKRFESGAVRVAAKTGAVIVPAAICYTKKVGPFSRKYIKIGKPITSDELGLADTGRENMKLASEKIRLVVKSLLEDNADLSAKL